MPTRTLGSHGLRAPAIGLGGISLSGGYGTFDEQAALATIDRAIDLDAAFIDSADNYPDSHNEKLIGRAIRDRREEVVLATKAGFDISRRSATQPFGAIDGRPAYLKAACERSLRALGVDTIDLYYLHRIDPSVPVEDSIGAMSALLDQGKVRYLGICEASADDLATAAATAPISVLQCEWSLWSREVEDTIVPAARAAGIGIVAYRPLGIGVLAGAFARPEDLADDDIRRFEPRFADASLARNLDLVSELRTLAADRDLTVAQLCLGWLLSRGDDVVPIPSTSKPGRLAENVAAAAVRLSETDLQRLEHLAPRHAWAGTRRVVTQTQHAAGARHVSATGDPAGSLTGVE
ncbi:MAG: aldo/keto reductase [Pseudonocardiaceae bacterium]|nr:aldo/keto reductase [Pseudonocardiaceae bacterium]